MQAKATGADAGIAATCDELKMTGRLVDYISAREIAELNDSSAFRIVLDGILLWGLILFSLALAHWAASLLVSVLCFIVVASRQLALTHMVHEASHFRLLQNKKLNDFLSDFFFAAPVLITTQHYRMQHLPHHKHLGSSGLDTDRRAWYTIRHWHFVRRSLLILSGGEALVTFLSYSKVDEKVPANKAALARRIALVAVTNGLLMAYCAWLGNVWLYFGLWVLPLFTLTMYLLTLRVIAEHQLVEYAHQETDAFQHDLADPLIRTVQPGPLGRFLLGPLNFFYHHEHHLAPSVRYTNLPKLHRLLIARKYYQHYPQALGPGYLATLYQLVFPRQTGNRTNAQIPSTQ